jgi:hypothetical protein
MLPRYVTAWLKRTRLPRSWSLGLPDAAAASAEPVAVAVEFDESVVATSGRTVPFVASPEGTIEDARELVDETYEVVLGSTDVEVDVDVGVYVLVGGVYVEVGATYVDVGGVYVDVGGVQVEVGVGCSVVVGWAWGCELPSLYHQLIWNTPASVLANRLNRPSERSRSP